MILGPENEAPDEWTSAHEYWNFMWQKDFRVVAWCSSLAGVVLSVISKMAYLSKTHILFADETILSIWKVLLTLTESNHG